MDAKPRRKAKVYGKKTAAQSSAVTAIFGSSNITPPPAKASLPPIGPLPAPKLAPTAAEGPTRVALDDITHALSNVRLDEESKLVFPEKRGKTRSKARKKIVAVTTEVRETRSGFTNVDLVREDPREKWLAPLIEAYGRNGRQKLRIQKWSDLLADDWRLEKIAESSFAEVYKVANDQGTSVLKLMALKPPKGTGSQRETAVTVDSVISEVLIMNMMTEIPGYLEFKGAHIMKGKPPKAVTEAYQSHADKKESFFPKPGSYHKDQLFLALELGDAGVDVEHFRMETECQLWDTFLGVAFALANGEAEFKFEHRDLHEGNVCLKHVSKERSRLMTGDHKYGYSGLEVTVLDYTLSRAEDEETIYRDLEIDPELFNESDLLQHQMYRRMRIWTFWRAHGIKHPQFDNSNRPQHGSWEDFMPFTNVIWIWYILDYIIKNFHGPKSSLDSFLIQTTELRNRLHPDNRSFGDGFGSAWDVLGYATDKGWVSSDDTENSGF